MRKLIILVLLIFLIGCSSNVGKYAKNKLTGRIGLIVKDTGYFYYVRYPRKYHFTDTYPEDRDWDSVEYYECDVLEKAFLHDREFSEY